MKKPNSGQARMFLIWWKQHGDNPRAPLHERRTIRDRRLAWEAWKARAVHFSHWCSQGPLYSAACRAEHINDGTNP